MKFLCDFFLAKHTKHPDGLGGEMGYCSYFVEETFIVRKELTVLVLPPVFFFSRAGFMSLCWILFDNFRLLAEKPEHASIF